MFIWDFLLIQKMILSLDILETFSNGRSMYMLRTVENFAIQLYVNASHKTVDQ